MEFATGNPIKNRTRASEKRVLALLLALVLALGVMPCAQAAQSRVKISYKTMQQRLVQKGYLLSSYATGKSNSQTQKALRIFKMMNGLTINSSADSKTLKKLFSSSARKKPTIYNVSWSSCCIASQSCGGFRTRATAVLIDLGTGLRINIRRVGGTEHLDVEPKTAVDTARLKKAYGGSWSWDSRAVLLIAGGKCYAAAMNGMPHGKQISKKNNFNGQFCVHLKNCKTHGSDEVNSNHQENIEKVYRYLTTS